MGHAARRYIDGHLARSGKHTQSICLDSSALISYLADDLPRADVVRFVLAYSAANFLISTVSLAEAMVRPASSSDRGIVDQALQNLHAIPRLSVLDFDQKHALEAAHVSAQTGLKLPDAAIVATARLAGARTLIGNDRQWRNMPLGVAFLCIDDILMTE
ncbi:MAG: type II toxin-antitoxin system VapC family toxin [Thermomicrobiales bacterium]